MTTGKSPAAKGGFRPDRTVVMIGPMAVGKSVIGAELAKALGVEFVDTDQQIVAKYGPVAHIFASHGEHYFRRLEARAVAEVLDTPTPKAAVLSLGGGAVLDSGTQQLLERAVVVYLQADLDTVRDRITRNTGRPLLAADPLAAWSKLAGLRAPVYERLADIIVDVKNSSVPELVERLTTLLISESKKENTAP
jgi:shikimate kinase